MSTYFNEVGEPLMDAAAMRFEMYLDSMYEPDPDDFYNRAMYEDVDVDPSECEHDDWSSDGREVECDLCGTEGVFIVKVDWGETDPAIRDHIVWKEAS